MTRIDRYPGQAAFEEAAAARILGHLRVDLQRRERVHLALAGGGTPRPIYRRMAREGRDLDWSRIHLWWGDERCVPEDHPRSNFRMARESLLEGLAEQGSPVPKRNVHPIPGTLGAAAAASRYEEELLEHLDPSSPRLDLVLLGMGADGHTASLFPGSPALDAGGWAAPADGPGGEPRVTLTLPALQGARRLLFLVSRRGKEEALAAIQGGGSVLPAARVRPTDGEVAWLILDG